MLSKSLNENRQTNIYFNHCFRYYIDPYTSCQIVVAPANSRTTVLSSTSCNYRSAYVVKAVGAAFRLLGLGYCNWPY